jgi:hypothetical protein
VDVSKQLHEYEVEYHVLQEEMSSPRPEEMEALRKAEAANRTLLQQNEALMEQLEVLAFWASSISVKLTKMSDICTIFKLRLQTSVCY